MKSPKPQFGLDSRAFRSLGDPDIARKRGKDLGRIGRRLNGSTKADPVNPAIAGEHLQPFFQRWKKD